jgi:hypothetical protein
MNDYKRRTASFVYELMLVRGDHGSVSDDPHTAGMAEKIVNTVNNVPFPY